MIDVETLRCFTMLETLSSLSKREYVPFSDVADGKMDIEEVSDRILYDDSKEEILGGDPSYPVVYDIDEDKHGKLIPGKCYDFYIDPNGESAVVRAVLPSDKGQDPYILVMLQGKAQPSLVIIENGSWYFDEE